MWHWEQGLVHEVWIHVAPSLMQAGRALLLRGEVFAVTLVLYQFIYLYMGSHFFGGNLEKSQIKSPPLTYYIHFIYAFYVHHSPIVSRHPFNVSLGLMRGCPQGQPVHVQPVGISSQTTGTLTLGDGGCWKWEKNTCPNWWFGRFHAKKKRIA